MCCILFFLYDRERRFAYIAILACICFALMIFSREFLSFFGYTFDRLMSAINGVLVGEQKEVRVFQYERRHKGFSWPSDIRNRHRVHGEYRYI